MEARIVPVLLLLGAAYEPVFLRYPAKDRAYTPDVVLPNGIALEIKGWFQASDRSKMLMVKAAYPKLDLRMVLASPNQRLSKRSATTIASWCNKHDIPYCSSDVPAKWINEPVNMASLAILIAAPKHKAAP